MTMRDTTLWRTEAYSTPQTCLLRMSSTQVHWLREDFTTWGRNGNTRKPTDHLPSDDCVQLFHSQRDSTWLNLTQVCLFLNGITKSPWVSRLKWSDLDDLGVPPGNSKSMPSFPLPSEATCQFHQRAATCCDPVAFWRFWQQFKTTIATFRDALGCCSWEQCWMNLLEHEPQKYDRQWVELTEPFAWRKWRKNVRKTKAVTTYL